MRDELLGLPAKDEDFVVPGVGLDELRDLLAPHGKVEELEVAGRVVGVRLHPRDASVRAAAPAGIELAPPRREQSTGPGRHDFEIVPDASLSIEDDMRRRDFTVNAIARRLTTGEIVDPFDGARDLRDGVLRTVTPRSFQEDPLRLVRGLRFVSQLGLEPDDGTLRQMQEEATTIRLVSGERIGGGLGADGMGELSKLLLGARPERALRLARDTGVLVELFPEFVPAIGYDLETARQPLPLEEHIFAVVQNAADAGASLAVRLGALMHDLGKPAADRDDVDHAELGAVIARDVLRRLRYPTRLRSYVTRLVRAHAFGLENVDALFARRFLRAHGEELARELVAHKRADLGSKNVGAEELVAVELLGALVESERASPYRLGDLAVDGGDLIAAGFAPGPELGRVLSLLLDDVVEGPERNTKAFLLERATQELL